MKTRRKPGKAKRRNWTVNDKLRKWFHAMMRCEYCGRPTEGCDPAHLPPRRAGGGSRIDSRLTLAGLCRGWYLGKWVSCHQDLDQGRIDPSEIEAVICAREKCLQHERTAAIEFMLTLPFSPLAARAKADRESGALAPAVRELVERSLKEGRV